MKVKLKHIRNVQNGQISNMGGITVAAIVDDNLVVSKFATAKCHTKDNFNKAIGRTKAVGRLNSNTQSVTQRIHWDDLIASLTSNA